jgi:glycosyltransferase involved in cell wall biosynthesis
MLTSLATQMYLPSEVVVCDDCSTDETQSLLEEFAEVADFEVRIYTNRKQQGVVKNFSRAIELCEGDYVVLADQDDVWRVDKLKRLATEVEKVEPVAIFSDAEVVDEDLASLGFTMWSRVKFSAREQDLLHKGAAFSVFMKHQVVTGATLCFKADLRDRILPIPMIWPHDAWIASIAAANGQVVALPETLVAYRQHSGNVVGGRRRGFFTEAKAAFAIDRDVWYRTEIRKFRVLAARLGELAPSSLSEKIAHLEVRAGLPLQRWRRFPAVMGEVFSGGYSRYARNWGSIGIDLLIK